MKSFPNHTDNELIKLVAKGDEYAFRGLFDKYRNKIFSIAWKITGTQFAAEDIVQEVFIKLWIKKESLSEIENFNAYLNSIVKNHVFNRLRKIAHEEVMVQKLQTKPVQKNNDVFENTCYRELENLVQKAISQLPSQQKKVYTFSRIEGLKYEEIAEKMGISRSTVKGHITGALRYIKNYLSSNNELVILLISFQLATLFLQIL